MWKFLQVQKISYSDIARRNGSPRVTDYTTSSIFSNKIHSLETTPASSRYEWRTGRWGECSKTCEGGVKFRKVGCIDTVSDYNNVVDDQYCDQGTQPANSTRCNEFRCPMWNWGKWGKVNLNYDDVNKKLCFYWHE